MIKSWAKIQPGSAPFRAAEKKLGMVAVGLLGFDGTVPRKLGDNRGGRPVKVFAGSNKEEILRRAQAEQPYHQCVIHGWVWVRSDAHGKLLKAEIDERLLGNDDDARLLGRWRECDHDPAIMWAIMLQEINQELGSRCEMFDDDERVMMIQKATYRG
jgi:hypothetical protein